MLLYLSDVVDGDGGETAFPLANPPVQVRAKKGNAIIWRNCILEAPSSDKLGPDQACNLNAKRICCRERDFRSIHAGLPIYNKGEKFTATRWVREGPSADLRHFLDVDQEEQLNTKVETLKNERRQKAGLPEKVPETDDDVNGDNSE